ncbi:mannitol-1-phosphate 5-dehydrogenase [Salibacterium salarium]|uniref:Mannitol-1-phosphate 5-dehydrogenase n=1 Tax=Salibacterium salarium TaxID=284579 RepID=A0A428N426_9BACI|nr:mannitol-1-phosphate 5-dehydrogenase [Salibacterium salarium]RSL33086.1 mannitol-1-phosphate 5-dehydrogenase [Salibacterium salarium]
MKALQIGAGNIGRGFIGQLLFEAGYHVCFADINDELIGQLQEDKQYNVELAGEEKQVINVQNVDAVHSTKQEAELLDWIVDADLITTAVGPDVLKGIAPVLAQGLQYRIYEHSRPVNVIACENMAGATDQLKDHIFEHLLEDDKGQVEAVVGFANSAVDRIVPIQPEENKLAVTVEPFFEWAVETPALKGEGPSVPSITFVEDLTPYIERKLFTVNTGHAALAYHGYINNCESIKEAIEHDAVYEMYQGVLSETSELLVLKHGFSPEDMEKYKSKITSRFQNPYISDTVQRVGRGPIRKMGPQDRLVRPALELMERQQEPIYLARTIAALLDFQFDQDSEAVEVQQQINESGKRKTLSKYTDLPEDHSFISMILSSN